ncbi:MAG: ABC transporter permease subunit [Ruminobacter sp.]|nr:ABC transporter permease subunit [Ruminobacter sp.]
MKIIKTQWPLISAAFTAAVALLVPDSSEYSAPGTSYFLLFTALMAITYELFLLFGKGQVRTKTVYRSAFWGTVILAMNIFNVITTKYVLLPPLYFPSPEKIFSVLISDSLFLGNCLLYTLRIQLLGWLFGCVFGILTGIALGFSSGFKYWVQPLVRILGPIPPTAWIPIVLVVFPSIIMASSFLIALAVWFPTTVLTANGIANIKNSYFEVGATLGASKACSILKIGIPAAMPFMFIGIFNGTCSSFITLVTAEMLGAEYGIGWYINWQKEMMSYANVYAGLIVMSLVCYLVITALFKIRDRILVWQAGVIKW